MKEGLLMDFTAPLDVVSLVVSARENDEAFSELLCRYTPMMNKLVNGFVGPLVTFDEGFAEACVAFHRAVSSYDLSKSEEVTFGLYSRICVYRRLCDFVAKRSKESEIAVIDPDQLGQDVDIEEAILTRERFAKYLECVRGILSKYEYSVFSLYVDGYSTAEIAHQLGKDMKSIENAKSRAFKRLREAGDILAKIIN